jgi:hypothetical protein
VKLYSWANSWCGSGRVMVCSCNLSNRMDSQSESATIRVVQQRRRNPTRQAIGLLACCKMIV